MSFKAPNSSTPETGRVELIGQLSNLLTGTELLVGAPPGTLPVLREMFHTILRGHGVWPEDLAEGVGMPEADLHAVITLLVERGRAERSADGYIVGAAGLSLIPTDHAVELARVPLYTWCALDAVGIPASLGLDATITSGCAACDCEVSVAIDRGIPTNHLVASVPTAACANPRDEFCGSSRFFCTDDHARGWLTDSPPTMVLTMPELASVGKAVWAWVHAGNTRPWNASLTSTEQLLPPSSTTS